MSVLDGVVGVKQITTDDGNPVPTRGILHIVGATATVVDNVDDAETILILSTTDGAPATAFTPDPIEDDVVVLDGEGLDLANVVRLMLTNTIAMHGLAPPSPAGNPRKTLLIRQGSIGHLEIKHGSATAPAGKRFACPGGFSYRMLPDTAIDVLYDESSSVWRVVP